MKSLRPYRYDTVYISHFVLEKTLKSFHNSLKRTFIEHNIIFTKYIQQKIIQLEAVNGDGREDGRWERKGG